MVQRSELGEYAPYLFQIGGIYPDRFNIFQRSQSSIQFDSRPGRRSLPCNRAVKADRRWLNRFQKNHRELKRVLFFHSFLLACFEFRLGKTVNQFSNYPSTDATWILV